MGVGSFEKLENYVAERITEFNNIGKERIQALSGLAASVREEIKRQDHADLIFICTHNSRRSHLGHLWAQMATNFYQLEGVNCYSGGTEATAFNPAAVQALERAGMIISREDHSVNPVYLVKFPGSEKGIQVFSKKYTDPPNPGSNFIAVMTCSEADENCPIVYGAIKRHSLTYKDPKEYDGTPREGSGYDERCRQIAREMFFLFSRV